MKSLFNFLTFILLSLVFSTTSYAILSQEELKTHLRWKISVDQNQVQIKKQPQKVILETFNTEVFKQLESDVNNLKQRKDYHAQFTVNASSISGKPHEIIIELPNRGVELFNFYKKDAKAHILDYWINSDVINTKAAAVVQAPKKIKVAPKKTVKKITVKKKKVSNQKITNLIKKEKKINTDQRDFRYGSAFIWDYAPLIPQVEKIVDTSTKTPAYFYEVKDREILADKKEAHMQLTINFYKKEKWGLMTRSIRLYQEKYGNDSNSSLNDFMSAVSIIKNTIKPTLSPQFGKNEEQSVSYSDKGILSSAYTLLNKVAENTSDIALKNACISYLIQQSLDDEDYIKALGHAKKLYVMATEEFDDDNIIYSSKVILHSLTKLSQLAKITEFLENKSVKRVLTAQEGMAYESYVKLAKQDYNDLIKSFEANKSSLKRPIHSSILFNVGEAYFRKAQYKQANVLMSEFIAQYAQTDYAGFARLRMALAHDLQQDRPVKVKKLYENVINNNANLESRIEAKIRYVGYTLTRQRKITEKALASKAFLDFSDGERKKLSPKLKELLWLTRLRTMIVENKPKDALAYLSTIPVDTMTLTKKKVFERDGAQIVLGLLQKKYNEDDYIGIVKSWGIYEERYGKELSKDAYLNYILAESYLNLGLDESFERTLSKLNGKGLNTKKHYPSWIEKDKDLEIDSYVQELSVKKLLKEKNYRQLSRVLNGKNSSKNINYNFYNGIVAYELREYNKSVISFEKHLADYNPNNQLKLSESIRMINNYLEALFQTKDSSEFRKKALAVIGDLRRNGNSSLETVLEKAEYLYIESIYSDSDSDKIDLARRTKEFLNSYGDSRKKDRVTYIHGVALLKDEKKNEGMKVLEELINKEGVPEYLKGLARSELATLKLNEITL